MWACGPWHWEANPGLTRLEQEELAFMKSSLKREIDDAPPVEDQSLHGQEKAIRRAYRSLEGHLMVKFDFQMRILNLAKEALVKGDGLGAEGWADEEEEEENATKTGGRELPWDPGWRGAWDRPGTSRASDDILPPVGTRATVVQNQFEEYALEEGVRFDDPDQAYFVGHTLHGFREAFAANWSQFLREASFVPRGIARNEESWQNCGRPLQSYSHSADSRGYQVELDGAGSAEARLAETSRQLARQALAQIAGMLHHCGAPEGQRAKGGRDPPLAGPVPESGNTAAWVEMHLKASLFKKVSRNLRALFAGHTTSLLESCAIGADREARAALLELNLETWTGGAKMMSWLSALEHLSTPPFGDGANRADVAQVYINLKVTPTMARAYLRPHRPEELRAAHAAAAGARALAVPLHCQESGNLKRTQLERLWEEYNFGPLVEEAYPCDPCGLQALGERRDGMAFHVGLSLFLEFHIGRGGELLDRRAEPDKTVLKALRGLLNLQQVLARPAFMASSSSGAMEGWRQAVTDLEEAVWKGIAFPELHTAAGQLMAELAVKGFLPEVFAAAMEHPPVVGAAGTTLPQGREPSDVTAPRAPRFQGMSIPGYNMKPLQRFEERALRLWGDEEVEENWDPIRLGLSYIDLTPACDLPLQVAMCFLSAALWLWRGLELLGDDCGGDAWLDLYIFEDIWAAPPSAKKLAMQYSLKRAILELVDYAANMAEHQLLPGARLAVQRVGFLLLRKVTARFGAPEDGTKVLAQLKRFFAAARVNPLWSVPLLPVADAVFIDILAGKLHSAYLEKLHESDAQVWIAVLPHAVPEYTLYEAALLGGSEVNVTYARYEVMGALLRDTQRTWQEVESLLTGGPFQQDAAGFALGRASLAEGSGPSRAEFAAVRGLRIDASTGQASLILARPSAQAKALLSLQDIAAVLSLPDTEPLALMLDPPSQKGAGMAQYPHHPFQKAAVSPGRGAGIEEALVQAALAVQHLASGTEVSFRAPFPTRPCDEGVCRVLPKALREKLQPIRQLRTEAWDVPSRLVLECPRIPYWQAPAGNIMEIRFGDPKLEVHAGQPLRELNEEEFRKWPVGRLQFALNQVEKDGDRLAERKEDLPLEDPGVGRKTWGLGNQELGSNRLEQLPALEKQELVDRLLRAAERGLLIEDDEETGEPLVRFSRRLTHLLPQVGRRWPHLARLGPLCAVRAAGLILQNQLQQMNESVKEQQDFGFASELGSPENAWQQQEEAWRGILAEVHAGVLRQQGFVDLDPGRCFEAETEGTRSFARCCSVGDHAEECFGEALSADRCCGRARRAEGPGRDLVAAAAAQLGGASSRRPPPEVLIPVVDRWLKDPAGLSSGETNSMAVVRLLVEEVQPQVKAMQNQLSAPVEKLSADLQALSSTKRATLSAQAAQAEAWLPAPALLASGGRRSLYATVALSPQLLPLEPDEALAAAENLAQATPGAWPEVPLEDLAEAKLQLKAAQAAARAAQSSPKIRAVYEATRLLKRLDEKTEELEERTSAKEPEDSLSECLAGWRDVSEVKQLTSGSHIRVRRRHGEDMTSAELRVETKLVATGEPGTMYTVWEVTALDSSQVQYLDLLQPGTTVSVPCEATAQPQPPERLEDEANFSEEGEVLLRTAEGWPGCIEVGVSTRAAGSTRGLFVNLGALGVEQGCFQNDCSHSDHFEAASPARCAEVCQRIAACGAWTFWEATGTCWLRANFLARMEKGAVSGAAACVPPVIAGKAPTLFALVTGKSGTTPPAVWEEWDLVAALEEFGHLTLSEIQRLPSSSRQRTALRVAAKATHETTHGWR
ncbi:unnamed protein product [Effrenium voratum]|nr:unnamed protein product [Effrenium voratum]